MCTGLPQSWCARQRPLSRFAQATPGQRFVPPFHSRYDPLGRLASVTDANGHTTTYGYDDAGRLASLTDRNGATTRYSHDSAGRVTGVLLADGSSLTYTTDEKVNSEGLHRLVGELDSGADAVDLVANGGASGISSAAQPRPTRSDR
jgi:YD repeat-containing protein